MNTIEEIAIAIKRLKSAVIFTHTRPDGDTIGSAMALSRALFMLGIKNEVVNDSTIPTRYAFLSGAEQIQRTPTIDAEGYVCVDVSAETRLGELQSVFCKSAGRKATINIDHHISNTRFCKYNYVRECSSNCEHVAAVIKAMGVTPDKLISQYLLMGIVTDSGSFSHSDVNGDTLRAAASCLDAGADIAAITYEAVKKQSKGRAQLYAGVISNLRFFLEDRLAIALVTQDLLQKYELKADATEGIVDFALTIDAVEVSICLLEVQKGRYKASLRSKRTNVNEIAGAYGGGGHALAAGCMLFGDIEEIYDRLRYTVSQHMEE